MNITKYLGIHKVNNAYIYIYIYIYIYYMYKHIYRKMFTVYNFFAHVL